MKANSTKEKLQAGRTVLGVSLQQFRSPEIPRIVAAAGGDFVWLDAEHGMFDFETIQDMTQAALDAGITPLVRVGELLYSLAARALDAGSQGIIFPRVDDPNILREAISWTKFPPVGKRGFGIGPPQLGYEKAAFEEILEHHNRNKMAIVQIETLDGIDHADELLQVDHLDAIMVGPSDLSISMGLPGQFEHPDLLRAIERLIAACQRHGVAPGIHVRTQALAERWIERGMRLVSVGTEATLLLDKVTEVMTKLQARLPAEDAVTHGTPACGPSH